MELLSTICFAKHEMFAEIKTGYQTNLHVVFPVRKQQLSTSNKQYTTNGNLVGNPVFVKEYILC